jgi:hypothetical protein
MSGTIKYKDISNLRYVLEEPYTLQIPISIAYRVEVKSKSQWYIRLDRYGILTINKGYSWDGASGVVTIQDNTNRRASLVHDALYQLMREGKIDSTYRGVADKIFYDMLIDDGMSKFRAWYYYQAVKMFGGKYAKNRGSAGL